MDIGKEISRLQADLEAAEQAGSLSETGADALQTLRDGSVAGPGISTWLQGVSAAMSDELIGTVRGAVNEDFGNIAGQLTASRQAEQGPDAEQVTAANVATEIERQPVRQFRETNPWQAMAAEASGAVPLALANLTPQGWVRRGVASLAGGGLYGFGQGEGVGERAIGTGLGAVTGGALGFGLPAIGAPVKSLIRKTGQAVFEGPVRAGTRVARNMFKDAIEASGNSIEEAIKIVSAKSGRMFSLADISPNTQSYIDFAAHVPGASRQKVIDFLNKRRSGRINRLNSDLEQAFGTEGRYFDEFAALKRMRSGKGKELYNRAFYAPSQGVISNVRRKIPVNEQLETLLIRPSMRRAFKEAARIAEEAGVRIPKNIEFTPEGVFSLRTIKGKLGQPDKVVREQVKAIAAEFMHYLKLGLDDVVFKGKRTGAAGPARLFEEKATRKSFVEYLDAFNPLYKTARNAWAGDTQVMDAMEMGRSLFKQKSDELAGDVANMTKSELEAFQQGAVQALIDRLDDGIAGTNVLRDMQKGRVEKLFRATFPSGEDGQKSFNEYYANLHDELKMMGTERQVVSQSATHPRQQTAAAVTTALFGELDESIRTPLEVLTSMYKREFKDISRQKLDAVAIEFARIATQTDPRKLNAIAKELTGNNTEEVFRKFAPELLHLIPRLASSVPVVSAVSGIEGQRVREPASRVKDFAVNTFTGS